VIARLYEKGSLILMSNLAFGSWDAAFASDAVLTAAVLDCIIHYATIVQISGESYRLINIRWAGILVRPDPSAVPQSRGKLTKEDKVKPTIRQARRTITDGAD
jgi:phage major head subunit gpT-like protein